MELLNLEEDIIDKRIVRAVKEMGFKQFSPIQEQSIPEILKGKDVIGQAQTGTGKTAAFGIPLLQMIDLEVKGTQALVLCPTRELAMQAAEEIRKFAKYMSGIRVLAVYGGQEIYKQIKALKGNVQIIVGTPGRVMDHMRRHTIKLDNLQMVVLDEADEMLNMGFREDMEQILSQIKQEHQTVLFSATMPKAILDITGQFQDHPILIKTVKKELTVQAIKQCYYQVRKEDKKEATARLLEYYAPKRTLVFCNTKRQVDELISELKGRGYFADGIHGDMKQAQRDRVMADFRSGKTEILIATDVAARGIDVDDVDVVFNYDLPQDEEYYVHRIGRTGRAGREGVALSFVSGKEAYKLKDIERYCKTKIKAKPIPSMDDVKNTKLEAIFSNIKETIEAGGLSDMVEAVEDRLNMEDYTCLDVAAALLKMVVGDSLEDREELEQVHYDLDADRRGMVRLFINVGKKDKIKPANILGAITGESGIPGKLVGSIDMLDNYTFVEVPSKYADAVLLAMENVTIKGRKISMEKAKGTGRKKKKKR